MTVDELVYEIALKYACSNSIEPESAYESFWVLDYQRFAKFVIEEYNKYIFFDKSQEDLKVDNEGTYLKPVGSHETNPFDRNLSHNHNYELVWVSDDLEAFRCKNCGIEVYDPDDETNPKECRAK